MNGLIHFVWKHPSLLKRYNDESILMVGWLKKGGSGSAFLLVLVQDILKKRTEEVKLRNPQGIPKTSCVEPGGAPILHVLVPHFNASPKASRIHCERRFGGAWYRRRCGAAGR